MYINHYSNLGQLRIKICDDSPGGELGWSVIFQSSGKDLKKNVCVMKALDYGSLNKIGIHEPVLI